MIVFPLPWDCVELFATCYRKGEWSYHVLAFENVFLCILRTSFVMVERGKVILLIFLVFQFSFRWARKQREMGLYGRCKRNSGGLGHFFGRNGWLYLLLRDWLYAWEFCVLWNGRKNDDFFSARSDTTAGAWLAHLPLDAREQLVWEKGTFLHGPLQYRMKGHFVRVKECRHGWAVRMALWMRKVVRESCLENEQVGESG